MLLTNGLSWSLIDLSTVITIHKDNMASEKPRTALPPSVARICPLNLPRFRKKAGVSLDQIADRTKISLRFLRAIEAEEFDKLPGGIFSTSYLRQYAASIGYDAEALVAHYRVKMNLPLVSGK